MTRPCKRQFINVARLHCEIRESDRRERVIDRVPGAQAVYNHPDVEAI